jgi:murein L,D-transpeptidase YafK
MKGRRKAASTAARFTAVFSAAAAMICGAEAVAEDLRDPGKMLKKIDGLIGDEVSVWCEEKGLKYPPEAVLLRIFKQERELEIWAGDGGKSGLMLVKTLPICAMDFAPGTKLKQGDGKTPEGFYHPEFGYQSSNWWMWIDLDAVDAPGSRGTGSCFKMCVEYPNAVDRANTRTAGHSNPGGEICLHGNCVSAGCASMKNRDFLPVFAFSRHHNKKRHGKLQLHIFPFRFDRLGADEISHLAAVHAGKLGKERLLGFWMNLKEGFDRFKSTRRPLKTAIEGGVYKFK